MRMVVDDHDSRPAGRCPVDSPLRPAAIDDSILVLMTKHERNLILVQAAFADTHCGVSGPVEAIEG